jgi:hypothetical protein
MLKKNNIDGFETQRNNIEEFKTQRNELIYIDLLNNKEIQGSFIIENVQDQITLNLGKIHIVFDMINNSINIDKNIKEKFVFTKGDTYNFRVLLFPLENYIILVINNKVVYSNYNNDVGVPYKKIEVLSNNINKINKLIILDSEYSFIDPINELYKIDNHDGIWNIEKRNNYYSIINIDSELYLGMKDKVYMDKMNTPYTELIILNGKNGYLIINKLGNVMNLSNDNIWYDKMMLNTISNMDDWLKYGSTINVINSTKQYLSGNPNFKYNFSGSSGLPAVYCDNEGNNQLIGWTIESLEKYKIGKLIKKSHPVYLKNNGMYLQIIRGNPPPSKKGMEISLGTLKNDNSKWNIISTISNRLYKKDIGVYFYHPKTDTFLYNTGNKFKLVGIDKIEIIGLDVQDNNSKWTISNIIPVKDKINTTQTVNYNRFKLEKKYMHDREKEWKKLLDNENKKVKEQLIKYNKLKGITDDIELGIKKTKLDIEKILKEKCPAAKVCLNSIDYNCIPPKQILDTNKTEKPYDIVYVKKNNTKPIDKRTMDVYDINRCGPNPMDYISIESIPEDKKITDFKINELPGFNRLKLK